MNSLGAVLLAAGLVGCAPTNEPKAPAAPTPTSTSAVNGVRASTTKAPAIDVEHYQLSLPEAVEGLAQAFDEAPNIVCSGARLWVDEQPAGDAQLVLHDGRLRRLDGLFELLVARRTEWKSQHPGAPLPGYAVLWFDSSTPLGVFKSVFQTAAFAGYPSLQLAVQKRGNPGHAIGYQEFRARVPGPPGSALPNDGFSLHVDYTGEAKLQLAWKAFSKVERVTSVGETSSFEQRLALLPVQLEREWQAFGGHVSADDRQFDQAVLHVPNDQPLALAVRLLDAIYTPKRDYRTDGKLVRVPAFSATFAVN